MNSRKQTRNTKSTISLPKNWEKIKLKEIAERVTSKNKGRSDIVLTISAEHGLIAQEDYFTKKVASKNLDNYLYLQKNDFAYNKSYSNGYPFGAVKRLCDYEEGIVSNIYICFRFKDVVSIDYMEHYFDAGLFHKEIYKIATEGVRNHGLLNVSIKDFFNIEFIIPPLDEQLKIASILSTWDEAISMYSQLLDLKKSKKKHYLQYIFLDLTYFSKQNIKYDKQPLGDIAFTQSGGTPLRRNKEYYNGNISWAVIADMTSNNKYLYETKETITDLGYKNSNVKLYEPNTILYAMYASIGECVITKIQTTANQAILNIKPIDAVDVEYLYYYLISIKEKVRLQGQQGTQSNLNAKMVREMRIPIPSKEVQLDISNFLRLLDDELELIEKLIEQLQEQKRGLMQLLLTGKVRV